MSPGLESWKGPSHAKAIKSACACFWFIYGYISMFTSKSFIHLKFFLMKTGSIYTRFSLYSSQPLLPEPYRQSYLFSHRFELLSSKFSNFCVPLVPGLFMPSCFFFFPLIFILFLWEQLQETLRKEVFHPLVHFLVGHNYQGKVNWSQEPEAAHFPCRSRGPNLWVTFPCCARHIRGNRMGNGIRGTRTGTHL